MNAKKFRELNQKVAERMKRYADADAEKAREAMRQARKWNS